jgi:Ca2+-binding EF-hand superfamily protein
MTIPTRRSFAVITSLVAIALSTPVLAQDADTKANVKPPSKTVRALFNNADKNKDGNVTRAEAKGRLPLTYRDFDKIDTDKKGSINFEQFMAYTNARVAKQADDTVRAGDKF